MKIVNAKENVQILDQVYDTFFSHGETVNKGFLTKDESVMVVAYEENQLIGMVYGYVLERPDTMKKQLFIYNVEVLESYRRKGVGSELLKSFLESIPGESLKNAFLIVDQTNDSAIEFYKSLGGRQKHMEDDYSLMMIWEGI